MALKNLVESRIAAVANIACHEIVEQQDTTLDRVVELLDRAIVEGVYTLCQGNKLETAKRLGISRQGLYTKLEKYGLSSPEEEVVKNLTPVTIY